jgi:hypothetical protein
MARKMTQQELERQTTARLEWLQTELRGSVEPARVTTVGRRHFDRLSRGATVTDFIPLLVYRLTREELLREEPRRLNDAA